MTVRGPPRGLVQRFLPQYIYLLPRLVFLGEQFPAAIPTSWYRDFVANFRAGGNEFSQHLLAFAVDWDFMDRGEYEHFAGHARAIGLVAVVESDHVHVQLFPAGVLPAGLFNQEEVRA